MMPRVMSTAVLLSNLAIAWLDSYRPRGYWPVLLSNLVSRFPCMSVAGEYSHACRAGVF